ncbi:MAG: geranylgeranyl reductase, partial [Rubrivivax sp.]
ATGAVPAAAIASGVNQRRTPSGMALRGYVKNEALAGSIRQLQVVWHPRLRGGYGWIFPAPGGSFNIGVGLTGSHARGRDGRHAMQDVNLREMLASFCEVHAPARELMAGGTPLGEVKGAPLRFSLQGALWSRPGLLATGEVIGSTYAFTGEGIGKALETGMLAAEALLSAGDDAAVRLHYAAALQALRPKFELYDRAAHVNHRPWLADLVVWRARRSPRILRRLGAVLEERQSPARLFTLGGIAKLMFE